MDFQRDEDPAIQDFLRWSSSARRLEHWDASSATEDRCFIPQKSLESYFEHTSRVERLLRAIFREEEPIEFYDTSYILRQYLRTFSILLCIGQGRFIKHFVQYESLQDSKLPFPSEQTDFPRSAQCDLMGMFQKRQWEYCVPALTYNMQRKFEKERILPIVDSQKLSRGASAVIYKIAVEEEYNKLQPPLKERDKEPTKCNTFVMKKYRGKQAEEYFETERKAFLKLRHGGQPPPNIVEFYGSYIQEGLHHIILEYMDLGTLREYTQWTQPPSRTKDIWSFWDGLLGVLRGLTLLHGIKSDGDVDEPQGFAGWHQDVTPSNILVKSRASDSVYDCAFKLADLGISHFKKASTSSLTDKDSWGTFRFGAPESFRLDDSITQAHFEIPQSVDVWSFGCVLSEAAVWLTQGYNQVEEYQRRRQEEFATTFGPNKGDAFHNGSRVLSTVSDAHFQIDLHRRRGDILTNNILRMVDNDMLVPAEERSSAKHIYHRSMRLLDNSKQMLNDVNHAFGQKGIQPQDTYRPATPPSLVPRTPSLSLGHLHPSPASTLVTSSGSVANHDSGMIINKAHNEITENPPLVPSLSVHDGLLWKSHRKNGVRVPMPGQEFLDELKNRDHVFLIDNAASMQPYHHEVKMTLELLAYILKDADPEGIDLYFTSNYTKGVNTNKSAVALQKLETAKPGTLTNMSLSLGSILQRYQALLHSKSQPSRWSLKRPFSPHRSSPYPRQLSLYVFTDGVWQPRDDPSKTIKALIDHLVELHLHGRQVGIQFIRFGNNKTGMQRLESLDAKEESPGFSLDIVDTTPSNGNVWKMLLGSINDWFDKDG